MIVQGDVWWTAFGDPDGSEAGFTRPSVVVQGDELNASNLGTVVVVPLTSNTRRAALPGAVELTPEETGLPKTSVAVASLVTAVDKDQLLEREGRLPASQVRAVLRSLDVVLGR